MRTAHRVLAYVLAAAVVVQIMAIAYALAGLGHWIDDGNTIDESVKKQIEEGDVTFQGVGGFAIHGINGTMIIPLIAIIFLVVSLFANRALAGAAKRGGILFVMVAVQVALGIGLHDVVLLAPLHALNGLGILAMAGITAQKAAVPSAEPVAA